MKNFLISIVKKFTILILVSGIIFAQAAGGVNYKKLKVKKDSFEGTTKHYASLKANNSLSFGQLLGEFSGFKKLKYNQFYQILRVESDEYEDLVAYFLILTLKGDGWIFMEQVTFKNPKTKWKKTFKWDFFDVNQKYIYDGIISEMITIPITVDEVNEMLIQSEFLARVYGKEGVSDTEVSNTKSSKLMFDLVNK